MLSLVILKPDAVERELISDIIGSLQGRKILHIEMRKLWPPELQQLYSHHADKEYWPRIESFMSRGPSVLVVVECDNNLREYLLLRRNQLRINTDSPEKNVIHCSEPGEGIREISLMCPGFPWPEVPDPLPKAPVLITRIAFPETNYKP